MVATVEPVDWRLAERVAKKVGGHEPFLDSYHYRNLKPELTELTAQAEELVAAETGLTSMAGAARAQVATRALWVDVNVASFQRLLRPVTNKMAERVSHSWLAPMTQRVSGTEMGAVLGWMSTRVLGQYDLLIIEDDRPEDQDIVYYVGPNVMALEHKHGFDPHQFRLWLALHETTHRAQFTGIEWLRPHFLSLVQEALDAAEPDLEHFKFVAKQVIEARRRGEDPLADGGIPALLATPEQKVVLDRIGGMMSLLEGHGDITMDRAGADHIPDASRFARVLRHPPQLGQRGVQAGAAHDRHRGQAEPVRRRGGIHRDSGVPGRPRPFEPGMGVVRTAAHHDRDPQPAAMDRPGQRHPCPGRLNITAGYQKSSPAPPVR